MSNSGSDAYPALPLAIPELPKILREGFSPDMLDPFYRHHPISRGPKPRHYRPEDLRDQGEARTPWVEFFEKTLVGLYWEIGGNVPYAFVTLDGRVRSLDAGCLKFLRNRKPPEVLFHLDAGGYIAKVEPTKVLLNRHFPKKQSILKSLRLVS